MTRFEQVMSKHLKGDDVILSPRPKDLLGIYGIGDVSDGTGTGKPHGVLPKFKLYSPQTSRAIFVEIKRQQKDGNAHERACRFMMPGMLDATRKFANQPKKVIPFWWIFAEGIAEDPKFRKAILFWFKGVESNCFLWGDMNSGQELIVHYQSHIRPLLCND